MTQSNHLPEGSYRPSNATLGAMVILVILTAIIIVVAVRTLQRNSQDVGAIHVPADYPSIQGAINAANPGDTIQVAVGIYYENLILSKPIVLVGGDFDQNNPLNNQTILDGGSTNVGITIPPGLAQPPTIRGFVIQHGTDAIQASSPFVLEYSFLHSATNLVSYQAGSGGINFRNVYFQAVQSAIRLDNMNYPLRIDSNRIIYNGQDGIEINLQGVGVPPVPIEIQVLNNMLLENNEDGLQIVDYPGDPQDTNRRFTIAGNLFAANKKAGLGITANGNPLEDYSGADTSEAIRVYNNTFYGNDVGISGGDNLVAFNNIITGSANVGVWRVEGPVGSNSVVASSLFFNNRLDTDQTTLGPGNVSGDPLFLALPSAGQDGAWNTVDDDFNGLLLQPSSQAIDKGVVQYVTTNSVPVPPHPINNFKGSAPDLGWREQGDGIFLTPTVAPVASFTPLATFTPIILPTLTFTPLPSATPLTPTITSLPPTALPSETPTILPPTTSVSTPVGAATTIAPVVIQQVNPNNAQGNTSTLINIVGSGFQNGALITFEGGTGLPQEVVSTQFNNSNSITVVVNVRNDGTTGTQVWDIRVTNPDSSSAVLLDAFTVVPQP